MGQAIKKFGWKRNDLVISTKARNYFQTFEQAFTMIRSTGAEPLVTTQSITSVSPESTLSRASMLPSSG
jgi:hypothetical protein